MTILVTFQTHEGQTEKIARRLGFDLVEQQFDVEVVTISEAPSPEGYEAVVVGTSIRFERHSRRISRYLRRHRQLLAEVPLALFQVSMTSARADAEHKDKADQLVRRLLERTGVYADLVAEFAGALRYSEYSWMTKRVMRSIARREGNDTDLTRDHEYTDWTAVDQFANDVAAVISTRANAS